MMIGELYSGLLQFLVSTICLFHSAFEWLFLRNLASEQQPVFYCSALGMGCSQTGPVADKLFLFVLMERVVELFPQQPDFV
jgi:hypothetical protein